MKELVSENAGNNSSSQNLISKSHRNQLEEGRSFIKFFHEEGGWRNSSAN